MSLQNLYVPLLNDREVKASRSLNIDYGIEAFCIIELAKFATQKQPHFSQVWDKSDFIPKTKVTWLGVIINTINLIPQEKIVK